MSSRLGETLALVAFHREIHKECEGCPVEDLCDQAEALVNVAKAAEGLRRPAGRVYCNGGDETCEDCVGSCGIEEWIEFREALAALGLHP